MPINMTDYKMIIHERIYNVLQIMIDFGNEPIEDRNAPMERPIIMLNTDNTPVFCRNQCANTKCAKHITKAYECGGACSMQLLRGQPECAGYISRRKRK